MNAEIQANRTKFLSILRTGNYKKGCIRSDENGKPIIETPEDDDGCCTCGIMYHEFPGPNGKLSMLNARTALGITRQDCDFIQQELNDTPLTFPQIADRIEAEVFFHTKKAIVMIAATELRIGNQIWSCAKQATITVDEDTFLLMKKDTGFYPIRLTSESLAKLGFHGANIFRKDNLELEWGNASKCFQFRVGEWLIDIETVHHLQNIFFDLTGEELTIKP